MEKYHACITLNEDTVNAFTRAQFNMFSRRRKFSLLFLSVAFIFCGAIGIVPSSFSAVFVLIGCLLLVDVNYIPRRTAKAVLQSTPKMESIDFSFSDKEICITQSDSSSSCEYEKIIRIGSDRSYIYLFTHPGIAYIFTISSLVPDRFTEFKSFICSRTGLRWENAGSILSMNLRSLLNTLRSH